MPTLSGPPLNLPAGLSFVTLEMAQQFQPNLRWDLITLIACEVYECRELDRRKRFMLVPTLTEAPSETISYLVGLTGAAGPTHVSSSRLTAAVWYCLQSSGKIKQPFSQLLNIGHCLQRTMNPSAQLSAAVHHPAHAESDEKEDELNNISINQKALMVPDVDRVTPQHAPEPLLPASPVTLGDLGCLGARKRLFFSKTHLMSVHLVFKLRAINVYWEVKERHIYIIQPYTPEEEGHEVLLQTGKYTREESADGGREVLMPLPVCAVSVQIAPGRFSSQLPAEATNRGAATRIEAVTPFYQGIYREEVCQTTAKNTAPREKSQKAIQDEIRSVIRQITATVTFLPLLETACAFDLLIYTDKDLAVPEKWEESGPQFVANSEEVRLRSFTTTIHKVNSMVAYKKDSFP
ncbi:PREDICTED: mitotic spindle assembly checkpoint protein MAD2A [Pygoscelis adeliae]|uniref:mitotic spindle assembly checkpoint protein MAD2A n=1 Tax=Pygoscelis adeliae TaxID=9238 RepID=UPI0004F50128|nr:PREDICTED: mitotic spindle assembly checkpoint protein MAD2A [Pygoscelis adeliae]